MKIPIEPVGECRVAAVACRLEPALNFGQTLYLACGGMGSGLFCREPFERKTDRPDLEITAETERLDEWWRRKVEAVGMPRICRVPATRYQAGGSAANARSSTAKIRGSLI